jgi:hypothetical protein
MNQYTKPHQQTKEEKSFNYLKKPLDIIQYPFLIKSLGNEGIEANHLT